MARAESDKRANAALWSIQAVTYLLVVLGLVVVIDFLISEVINHNGHVLELFGALELAVQAGLDDLGVVEHEVQAQDFLTEGRQNVIEMNLQRKRKMSDWVSNGQVEVETYTDKLVDEERSVDDVVQQPEY